MYIKISDECVNKMGNINQITTIYTLNALQFCRLYLTKAENTYTPFFLITKVIHN